jgi:hypothetical protein
MVIQTGDNKFGVAKWIVDPVAGLGTHTTIVSALTSASSGDDIFIRPGTYTEDPTLKAGVNIIAFTGDDQTPNVTIVGNLKATFAGTCSISNIKLQTNGASFLTVSGSSNTVVNILNCQLLVSTAGVAGITYSTSGASAFIVISDCTGDVSSATAWVFTSTAVGRLFFKRCRITNSGGSTVVSTTSSTIFEMTYCYYEGNFQFTNPTGGSAFRFCRVSGATNYTIEVLTSGSLNVENCFIGNSTTGCITIGAGSAVNIIESNVSCISSNAIVGAGSLTMSPLSYGNNQGQAITASTIIDLPFGRFKTFSSTVNIAFGGSSTSVTFNTRIAHCWIVGKMVYFTIILSLSNNGTGTGAATITGLPVAAAASYDQTFPITLISGSYPAGATNTIGIIAGSATSIALWGVGTATFAQLTEANITNTSTVQMQGFYWMD